MMTEERPRDSWDEIIDQMPDTHGGHDNFTTTRDAVRWAISTAFSSGEYWVEGELEREPEPEHTTVREAAQQWVDMVRAEAARAGQPLAAGGTITPGEQPLAGAPNPEFFIHYNQPVDAANYFAPPHVHRWAWRTSGSQECFDCGARR